MLFSLLIVLLCFDPIPTMRYLYDLHFKKKNLLELQFLHCNLASEEAFGGIFYCGCVHDNKICPRMFVGFLWLSMITDMLAFVGY